jgi:hypothetical protein
MAPEKRTRRVISATAPRVVVRMIFCIYVLTVFFHIPVLALDRAESGLWISTEVLESEDIILPLGLTVG